VILFPAIDIRGGSAVRLVQGDYDRETTFDADPVDAAKRWADDGARWLHVVDLDGAREGKPANLGQIRRIARAVDCPIQVGGGIRDAGVVADVLAAGAERVVIGTAALRDPDFLAATLKQHGAEKVVVSVDARGGKVALAGWREVSDVDAADAVADLAQRGVGRFLFTPIEVDGTLEGPGIKDLKKVAQADAKVIYSGGVGDLSDLRSLACLAPSNVEGAIVGRALYDGRFTVAEGQAALER
jgi:phosphoribosylformimino-5-aminoimidazole carboxamide ribotide isomerase